MIEKAVNVAAGYVDKKEEVVDAPAAAGRGRATRCCCASASRKSAGSAMTELGVHLHEPDGQQGRVTTHSSRRGSTTHSSSPTAGLGTRSTADVHVQRLPEPLPLQHEGTDLGIVVKALQTRGLFQSLAEPNLVAESGKEASFLAGGEFPIPVAQGSGANLGDQRDVQGVRHPPELHADRQRRPHPSEGAAGGQHARLRQRGRAAGIPHPGAEHAPHRDRARTARTARRSRSPA